MATAAPQPSSANDSSHRTIITVVTLIGILSVLVLLALYGKSQSPRRRLEELQLQNELRRSGHRLRRKRSQERGIAPSLLQAIPAVKYRHPLTGDRRTLSLDLEKGGPEDQACTLSLSQSRLKLQMMQAEMTGAETTTEKSGLKGGGRDMRPKFEQEECPICTQPFVQDEYVRVLPCRHIHHQRCVDRWLLEFSGTCPVCRIEMDSFSLQSTRSALLPQKPEPAVCLQ